MIELLNGTNIAIAIVVIIALVALFLGKLGLRKKMPSLEKILKYAQIAVAAVEKLSDNGQYTNLPAPERHARKKEDAVRFVIESLQSEFGIKVAPTLKYIIDMAIEAALKQLGM